MEKYGFVYIWYDRKRKMYYIGCHWGTEDDGYICSSNRMRDAYRRRPQDFKRRILSRDHHRLVLLDEERKWLSLIQDNELGNKYYNYCNWKIGTPAMWSKEADQKRSEKMRGRIPWNKGKTGVYTEETKQKISSSLKGKIRPKGKPRKRNPHSEETKQKISKANKGRIVTNETKKKMSDG